MRLLGGKSVGGRSKWLLLLVGWCRRVEGRVAGARRMGEVVRQRTWGTKVREGSYGANVRSSGQARYQLQHSSSSE